MTGKKTHSTTTHVSSPKFRKTENGMKSFKSKKAQPPKIFQMSLAKTQREFSKRKWE